MLNIVGVGVDHVLERAGVLMQPAVQNERSVFCFISGNTPRRVAATSPWRPPAPPGPYRVLVGLSAVR
jgi:hypothetical protein